MATETAKNTKTILVVDDDPDFIAQHQMLLESAGYSVVTAESREEAEKMMDESKPDLAMIDLMMEKADDGFTLCYHIKKKHPNVPVILVTAVASETGIEFDAATEEERAWVKADAFLTKPIRFEQLCREIERHL